MKTALVLSAGGMLGAYQAGAWKELAGRLKPDLVVGTSIGALNGWAIAGCCDPDRLIHTWLHLDNLTNYHWQIPRGSRHGLLDSSPVEDLVQRTFAQYVPCLPYALVTTETRRLKPVIFQTPGLTWRHLAASVAIPGLFSQHCIDGRLHCDGGLLCPLPLWAAVSLGADRIVAIDALPASPLPFMAGLARALRHFAPCTREVPRRIDVVRITAPQGMGSVKDVLYWTRGNAERWVELGREHASAVRLEEPVHAV